MKLIVSIYPKNQEFLPLTFVFNATLAYNRAASPSRTVIRHTLFAILFLSPPPLPSLYDSAIVPSASLNII